MANVAVLIVAHNEAAHIARAIQSVLQQTYQDFDLMVIDDASTDNTYDIIQSFADPRLNCYRRPTASGAGAARNAAIGYAQSPWLAFLDADDAWHPEKLAAQLLFATAQDVDAVVCGFQLFRHDNPTPEIYLHNFPRDWPRGIVRGCHFSPGSGLLIKKSCFDRVGLFDESLKRLEDWDWWLRAAPFVACQNLPEPLIEIYIDQPPNYIAVAKSARILWRSHARQIYKNFGWRGLMLFWITLQFECAAASKHKSWKMFCSHLLSGAILHPRFWKKLLKRDSL